MLLVSGKGRLSTVACQPCPVRDCLLTEPGKTGMLGDISTDMPSVRRECCSTPMRSDCLNDMEKCVNHPDREAVYQCMKYGEYLCDQCLKCRDRELYCKFRPACPIDFLSKEAIDAQTTENSEETS